MNHFVALYLKELRAQRMVVGILLVGTLGLSIYALTGIGPSPSPRLALIVLPYVSALGLPFLLIHSISTEWTGHTHYQILALPVPRWVVLLAKVALVLSLGLAICLISTVFLQIIADRMTGVIVASDVGGHRAAAEPYIGDGTLWAMASIAYGMFLLPLLGIACAASGVRVMAQRFKGLSTLAVFVAGGYLYAQLKSPIVMALQKVFGRWQLDMAIHGGAPHMSDAHLYLIYSALFAALGIGLGALLFEKYVEA
ncbi:MAG: hypothetical protein HN712_13755 [Gemmatimonadetes bacterium]|nr:hypothetical protein [Gemmatimonadota bacterium]MBT6148623.1 hypothetical protein [Gemmatimonadota bacterium]MBT7861382.1 hypothetical protein [Gemmatimonadota bacterium]